MFPCELPIPWAEEEGSEKKHLPEASQRRKPSKHFEETSLCPEQLGSLLSLPKASVLLAFLSLKHTDLVCEVAINNMSPGPL